jgi:hypothetical protein
MMIRTSSVFLLAVFLMTALFASGPGKPQPPDLDSMLEAVRADVRADKVAIVTELMKLKPAEAEKFWPVYRKYDAEATTLNDERLKIIKEYSDKFASLTDEQAKGIAERTFAWEARRTQLRKTYFAEFTKATSALTAAKFFQVEHRLDLLVDFVVAAELPGLFVKTAESAKQ